MRTMAILLTITLGACAALDTKDHFCVQVAADLRVTAKNPGQLYATPAPLFGTTAFYCAPEARHARVAELTEQLLGALEVSDLAVAASLLELLAREIEP